MNAQTAAYHLHEPPLPLETVAIMNQRKPARSDSPAGDIPSPGRDRPPPYADPWREERWTDEADRASFQKIYDLFAHPRHSDQ